MIGLLTGRIVRRSPGSIVLDVGGVGYEIFIPLSTFCALPADGAATVLEIYTLVREDAFLLYGFGTRLEKSAFEALISVSGVGPKVALAVLAGMSAEDLVRTVESADAERLRAVPGVGRKLAERILLELKEKVAKLGVHPAADPGMRVGAGEEAESALRNLGYDPKEAREALSRARQGSSVPLALETLLKEALRILAR